MTNRSGAPAGESSVRKEKKERRELPKSRAARERYIVVTGITIGVVWLAAMTLLLAAWQTDPSASRNNYIIYGGAISGLALAATWGVLRGLEDRGKSRPWVEWTCFMIADGILCWLAYWCGMRQFGGFDCSALIDVGWRLYRGQQPYSDFPCTVPIGFYLGAEYAFRWFGVYWSSLVKINAIYLCVSCAWLYALLRMLMKEKWGALAITCASGAATMLIVGYWWYNPVTMMSATLYVTSAVAVLMRREKYWLTVSLTLSTMMLALMKPNTAALLLAGCSAVLFIDRRSRLKAAIASAAAFVLWMLVISIHHSSILQIASGYLAVAQRGTSGEQLLQDIYFKDKIASCIAFGLVVLLWGGAFVRGFRRAVDKPVFAVCTVAVITGVYGFLSNGEDKIVDMPMVLAAGVLSLLEWSPMQKQYLLSRRWNRYVNILCTSLLCASIAKGVVRHRVRTIGIGVFYEYKLVEAPFTDGFFRGLRTGQNFHTLLSLLAQLKAQVSVKDAYFGPRLQFAYAAMGIDSPKGLPVWWHPGVSFAAKDAAHYEEVWAGRKFSPLVFLDAQYYDNDFLQLIGTRYKPCVPARVGDLCPHLTVFRTPEEIRESGIKTQPNAAPIPRDSSS